MCLYGISALSYLKYKQKGAQKHSLFTSYRIVVVYRSKLPEYESA